MPGFFFSFYEPYINSCSQLVRKKSSAERNVVQVELGLLLVMVPSTFPSGCLHPFYMECSVTKAGL